MTADLSFLKELPHAAAFRPVRGYDARLDLCEDEVADVPARRGVYVLVAADGTRFVYPKGKSPVIYIGQASNLRRRLREHLKHWRDIARDEEPDLRAHVEHCSRYWYIESCKGARVYTFHCLKGQSAKDLESEVIWHFYEKYRALPVGNGARSFGADEK